MTATLNNLDRAKRFLIIYTNIKRYRYVFKPVNKGQKQIVPMPGYHTPELF